MNEPRQPNRNEIEWAMAHPAPVVNGAGSIAAMQSQISGPARPSAAAVSLAGLGGGCLTGILGFVVAALIGFAVCPLKPPESPQHIGRTDGRYGLLNMLDDIGDFVWGIGAVSHGVLVVGYTAVWGLAGAAIGVIPGIVAGVRIAIRGKRTGPMRPQKGMVRPVAKPATSAWPGVMDDT